jgi:acetyl esterase/lipase
VPGLLWIHGGGYVIGFAAQDDDLCKHYAEATGCVVASVEYRLAPEHPYPTPLEDCYTGLAWLAAQPFVDPDRIAIGGASAGGGLAAGLALLARDRDEIKPVLQLLAYPMIDDRTATRVGVDESGFRLWSNGSNAFGWRSYTGREPGSDQIDGLAAPSRNDNLSGLAPTWLGVGTQDLFHDEDLAYADRLKTAGVPCELHVSDGGYHAFDIVVPKASVSRKFRDSQIEALTNAFAATS